MSDEVLSDLRIQMEKYFQDNRTYMNGAVCGITATSLLDANNDPARLFDYTCPVGGLSATTYLLQERRFCDDVNVKPAFS